MPLYQYKCLNCGLVDLRHPMAEVDEQHYCPECGKPVERHFLPIHHRWPSNFYPGNEHSGQRKLLDPNYQAWSKDELARMKAEKGE